MSYEYFLDRMPGADPDRLRAWRAWSRFPLDPPLLAKALQGDLGYRGEGAVRWLEHAEFDFRVPVLVVEPDVPEVPGAANVVPIWTDVENATIGDLLLEPDDLSFGGRWLVHYREQTLVRTELLAKTVARLTDTGMGWLGKSLEFTQGPERTGTQLESEFDPRLDALDWMRPLLYACAPQLDE